jgi:ubiquinone/menaquinone biosynthesis C-methylase UbiE
MVSAEIRRLVTLFVLTTFASTLLVAQSAQENAADAERLIKVLDIHAGSVVGEIGAGDGTLTVAVARVVGDSGRVFSNEFNKNRLADISRAAEKEGLKNVTTAEGRENETNLGDQCCDAIFMRNVYHHFADPAAMNASLYKSLKPGGRLAVQDFAPPPGAESPTPAGRAADGHHGVTAPTVERELKAAGFEILSSAEFGFRTVLVVARRPTTELTEETDQEHIHGGTKLTVFHGEIGGT